MKTKPSETLRQMALTDRKLSWLGAVAETIAELEEDNARKDDAIAEQARQLKEALAALEKVKRERDAAIVDIRNYPGITTCHACKHFPGKGKAPSKHCKIIDRSCFEWKNPFAQNGGENA